MTRLTLIIVVGLLLFEHGGSAARAAEAEVTQLVTAEMEAQLTPEVRKQIDAAWFSMDINPVATLAVLAPLHARAESRTLNYWETFEVYYLVGEARRKTDDSVTTPRQIPYLQAAISYDTGGPNRGRYRSLVVAYMHGKELEKALEVAKQMVDLFDDPADAKLMDAIISSMNRQRQ